MYCGFPLFLEHVVNKLLTLSFPSRRPLALMLALLPLLANPAFAVDPPAPEAEKDNSYEQLKLFGQVLDRVHSDYVDTVTDDKLVEAAVNGMLTNLDPHSAYMNADEFKDMRVQMRGEFGGLGIEVTMENGLVKVISPIDDTPASKAGLIPGDMIVMLNETPVMGMTLQDAVNTMRGTPGSTIKLKVVRNNSEPFDVSIVRAVIKVQSVRWRTEDKVGYIRITSFNDQTQVGLDKAITEIKGKLGDSLQGWVLDLRNNPGGLLDQAISVSDTFLEGGEIVSTRGRNSDDNKHYPATAGDTADGKPIAVLINAGSASAAEIVSGALQDHHRAIVLGTKSFGKGSVQTVIPLPNNKGAIRLTTARYYTPSGRSIQAEGIVPDIVVEPARIEKISESDFLKEANLTGALKNDTVAATVTTTTTTTTAPVAPANAGTQGIANAADPMSKLNPPDPKKAEQEAAAADFQLARALDLIRGISLYGDAMKSPAPPPQKAQAASN